MALSQEVIDALDREKRACGIAIEALDAEARTYERRYGMSTDEFARRFDAGQLGDDHDFFVWYGLYKGLQEWRRRKAAIEEALR